MRARVGVLFLAAGAVAFGPAARAQAPPDRATLLARVAAYLKTYEQQFSAVVAEEDYVQLTRTRDGVSILGRPPERRELRSDVMVLNFGASHWVQFRDVYEVDGKPVRDHQSRLLALLQSPNSKAFGEAQSIANESARYNLGVNRNINVPMMALTYVTAANQPRSTFEVSGPDTIRGLKTVVVKFHETASPSLIHDPDGDVVTSGRDWVDPISGAVLRTELTCLPPPAASMTVTVTVNYALVPTLKMVAPISMAEVYRLADGEIHSGNATYSNFRSFSVDTSAFLRGGGGGFR